MAPQGRHPPSRASAQTRVTLDANACLPRFTLSFAGVEIMVLCRFVVVVVLAACLWVFPAEAYEPAPLVDLIGQDVEYDPAIPLP